MRATRRRKAADVAEFRARMVLQRGVDEKTRRTHEEALDERVIDLQRGLHEGDPFGAGRIASVLLRRFDGMVDAEEEARQTKEARQTGVMRDEGARLSAIHGVVHDLIAPKSEPDVERQASRFRGIPARFDDGTFKVSKLSPQQIIEQAALHYGRQYDTRPQDLWALAHHLLLRAVLSKSAVVEPLDSGEVFALRALGERAHVAHARRLPPEAVAVDPIDAAMACIVAIVLDPALKSADEGGVHEVTRDVVKRIGDVARSAEGGPQGFRAFSERRVMRRMSQWLPGDYGVARELAAAADAHCESLGVADRWPER